MEVIRRFFRRSQKSRESIYLEDLRFLSQRNNHLAVKLYHFLAGDKGNVLFSPLSISTGLAMLLTATKAETQAELKTALGIEQSGIQTHTIPAIFKEYMSVFKNTTDSFKVYRADMLLTQRCFVLKQNFKALFAQAYEAVMLEVDFKTQNKRTVSHITDWVQMKTYNMIPKLTLSLDPDSNMILLNTIYFGGNLLKVFPKEATRPENFYNKGDTSKAKRVQMMHLTETFKLYQNDSMKVLVIPFADKEVDMLIILPHAVDGLDSVEASLTLPFIEELVQNENTENVAVSLPRFRLDCIKSLTPCFRFLGAERIFDTRADMSTVTDTAGINLTEAIHNAVLELNDDFNETEALTDVEAEKNTDLEFTVDHPFTVVIYHINKSLILFMGRVEEL